MRQKDETELSIAEALKVVRSWIRTKHSLAADRELNEVLPKVEEAIRRRISQGKPYHADPKSLIGDVK